MGNSCFHIGGNISSNTAGVVWEEVRVPMANPNLPTSYFGGYLALIGLSKFLLFAYLILFYCLNRPDAKHLRALRLVNCAIILAISVAVLVMVGVKSDEYLSQGDSSDGNAYQK